MWSTSFSPGTSLTVARGYGQHQPTRVVPTPKFARMFDTGMSFFGRVRMNSHWSRLGQSSTSQRPSGDQTTLVNEPVPLKIVVVGPPRTPVTSSVLRAPRVSTYAMFFPFGEIDAATMRDPTAWNPPTFGPRWPNTSTACAPTATIHLPLGVQLS